MTKQDVIDLALSEVGYIEKSQANFSLYGANCLYSKTKYTGCDNITKYAYELYHAGLNHPVGYAWCQTFIAYVFWKSYKTDLANKLLCGKLTSASTMEVKNAMLSAGRQVPLNMAEAGDIVFRSRTGGGHVGLVVGRSSSGQIITVEGNSSSKDLASWNGGAVVKHTGASWEWCCRPDYALIPKEPDRWQWLHVGNIWYYQNQYGENHHGWAIIKESAGDYYHKYYFNAQGQMLTGYHWIDDKLCLFMPSGILEGALCVSDTDGYQYPLNLTTNT